MKKYSPTEIKQISVNMNYIMQKGNVSIDDLLEASNSSDGKIGISKNTYLKLSRYNPDVDGEWCPQEKTLKKIIAYVNENFSHHISLFDLIHDSLSDIEFTRITDQNCLAWYDGLYYCYYDHFNGDSFDRKYGLLKIFKRANQYVCEAILGMDREKFMGLEGVSDTKSLKSLYDNSKNPFEFFYRGTFFLQPESIVIHLVPKTNTFMKIVVIKRQEKNSQFKSYLGDIIGMITTTHSANHPTKYQQLAISRKKLKNDSDVDRFLALDNHNDRVVKNTEMQNNLWIDLILKL